MVATYSPHRHHGGSPFFDPRSPSTRRVYNDNIPRRSPLSSPLNSSSSPAVQSYSPQVKTRPSTRRNSPVRTRSSFAAQVSPAKFALQLSNSSSLNQSLRQACSDMAEKPTRSTSRYTRNLAVPRASDLSTMSSPMKRSDSIMNSDNDGVNTGSPKAKRRSHHGVSTPTHLSPLSPQLGTPTRSFNPSAKRSSNIKKNTVGGDHFEKPLFVRPRLPFPKPAPKQDSKVKRISSFDKFVSPQQSHESPFNVPPTPLNAPVTRGRTSAQKAAATRAGVNAHLFSHNAKNFSMAPLSSGSSSSSSFATPQNTKLARPNQLAFMSTGLLSKRNRAPAPGDTSNPAPPDTPSKKSVLFSTRKPAPGLYSQFDTFSNNRATFGKVPDTPFPIKKRQSLLRRDSFASITSLDESDNEGFGSNGDSQGSNYEVPPTPTKGGVSNLGSSGTFGQYGSVARTRKWRPNARGSPIPFKTAPHSPHTPDEPILPPDPSRLSISGKPSPFFRPQEPPQTPTTNSRSAGIIAPSPDTPYNSSFNQTTTPVLGGGRTTTLAKDWDLSLETRFSNVKRLGNGEFSVVFQVEQKSSTPFSPTSNPAFSAPVFAVKRIPFTGARDLEIRQEEINILKSLRSCKHIVQHFDDWKDDRRIYVQTEYCEYGGLDSFLTEYGNLGRMDPFRMWKIFAEITEGIKHIHDTGFLHLDIKPSNIFIAYDGTLKIGDFGMAAKWPAKRTLEREGDRQYIAPEVLSRHQYDKPADIFSLGLSMLEIAANIILPHNGESWQKLRNGDLSEVPDLSSASITGCCLRDDFGFPVAANDGGDSGFSEHTDDSFGSQDESYSSVLSVATPGALQLRITTNPSFQRSHTRELSGPPPFMAGNNLGNAIRMIISPDPSHRPTADQILASREIQWVLGRKEKAALVYEGEWGPLKAFEENSLPPGCQEMVASAEDLNMQDV